MRYLLKLIYNTLPIFIKKRLLVLLEKYYRAQSFKKEGVISNTSHIPHKTKTKKRILIYHISALYYGGTEKNLQAIAEILSVDYDVYIMHTSKGSEPNRRKEVESFCTIIDCTYTTIESVYPHHIHDMKPHIKQIIADYEIDLVFSAGTGKIEYPLITITQTPIVLINIFGSPALQENILTTIFISHGVKSHAETFTGPIESNVVMYIPVNTNRTKANVPDLRKKLRIPSDHFIFGRIGRNSDSIFDPIGIRAFEKLVSENKKVHYVIFSPAPALIKIVEENQIPNVHFLPPTANEEDIWSFYYGIDALAHFRFDGETCGLNITESMYAEKPILTHTSHIWNSHLEYLEPSFSRIAKKDDILGYYINMRYFYNLYSKEPEVWADMCAAAKRKAGASFSKETYAKDIKRIVKRILI